MLHYKVLYRAARRVTSVDKSLAFTLTSLYHLLFSSFAQCTNGSVLQTAPSLPPCLAYLHSSRGQTEGEVSAPQSPVGGARSFSMSEKRAIY